MSGNKSNEFKYFFRVTVCSLQLRIVCMNRISLSCSCVELFDLFAAKQPVSFCNSLCCNGTKP